MLEKLEKQLEDTRLAKEKAEPEKAEPEKVKAPPKEVYAKVVEFTSQIRRQYGELIKSVLIFGSAARGRLRPGSDIDVWVVLDDTATKSSEELGRITAHLYLIARELGELHIQTTPLTEFWQGLRMGSPELINFLRYGLPVHDMGFIKPAQRMLVAGLITPSEETVRLKARAAEAKLKKVHLDLKGLIFELRYTAIDVCQAVIMHVYQQQPDAAAIPDFLERLVKEKGLEPEWIDRFKELDSLWKAVDHKEIEEVTTSHVEKALRLAQAIVDRFKKLLPAQMLEGMG
jgi:predicted nucleotidyltransferase